MSNILRVRTPRFVFISVFVLLACFAQAAPSFPPLTGRIVDQANVLDPAVESRLTTKLSELEQATGNQLVVVTLASLQGYDISDYGYQLGRHWGIGQQGKNNGAILIVAPNERKVRIEVGYGLEGELTDAVSRLIIENAILPRFRSGDFAGGIERGVDDIVQVLSGDADDYKRRAAEQASRPQGQEGIGLFALVVLFIIIWLLVFLRSSGGRPALRRRAGWAGPPIIGGGWPGDGWSGRGGGGFSGGGSGGGFSGGGGSFGGGGASGSW